MKKQLLRKKCYQAMLALAGAAMLGAMPAAATSLPDITSEWNTGFGPAYVGGENINFAYGGVNFQGNDPGSFSVIGDQLTITGSFTDTAHTITYDNVLLMGTISSPLDYNSTVIDFYFSVTGGSARDLFGGIGGRGMTTIANYYDPTGILQSATIDTVAAPVPLPPTVSLLFVGGSALAAFRRRRVASIQ